MEWVFEEIEAENIEYNERTLEIMMKAFNQQGNFEKVDFYFTRLTENSDKFPVTENHLKYVLDSLLYHENLKEKLGYLQDIERTIKIHKIRLETVNTYNYFISNYAELEEFDRCFQYLDIMTQKSMKPNIQSFTALLASLANSPKAKKVQIAKAVEIMKDYKIKPSVHIYNCLLSVYFNSSDYTNVLNMYNEMEAMGVKVNSLTIYILTCTFVEMNEIPAAYNLYLSTVGNFNRSKKLFEMLIPGLIQAEMMAEAEQVLEDYRNCKTITPPIEIYTLYLAYYFTHNEPEKAWKLVNVLKNKKILDVKCYLMIINHCLNIYLHDQAVFWTKEFIKQYKLTCLPNEFLEFFIESYAKLGVAHSLESIIAVLFPNGDYFEKIEDLQIFKELKEPSEKQVFPDEREEHDMLSGSDVEDAEDDATDDESAVGESDYESEEDEQLLEKLVEDDNEEDDDADEDDEEKEVYDNDEFDLEEEQMPMEPEELQRREAAKPRKEESDEEGEDHLGLFDNNAEITEQDILRKLQKLSEDLPPGETEAEDAAEEDLVEEDALNELSDPEEEEGVEEGENPDELSSGEDESSDDDGTSSSDEDDGEGGEAKDPEAIDNFFKNSGNFSNTV